MTVWKGSGGIHTGRIRKEKVSRVSGTLGEDRIGSDRRAVRDGWRERKRERLGNCSWIHFSDRTTRIGEYRLRGHPQLERMRRIHRSRCAAIRSLSQDGSAALGFFGRPLQ